MEIIRDTIDFQIEEDTVVTIGKFDGLHKGHELILNRMKEYRSKGYKTCVLTFSKPPASLGFGQDKNILMTNIEKERAFAVFGIDYLVEFPFDESTAAIEARDFVEEYIVKRLNAKAVVVGEDCTFGARASGNAGMLRDLGPIYGFDVQVLGKLKDGDREISSTYIRELVSEGNVSKAYELAFLPYFISGMLKRGVATFSKGITIYSVEPQEDKVLPKDGMYYTEIYYDEAFYPGITCVIKKYNKVATYIYGGIKGIASGIVSVVFMERMHDIVLSDNPEYINKCSRQDIFEGQKWHKEHGRK